MGVVRDRRSRKLWRCTQRSHATLSWNVRGWLMGQIWGRKKESFLGGGSVQIVHMQCYLDGILKVPGNPNAC